VCTLGLAACALERDWEKWQIAALSWTDSSDASSGTSEPAASSTTTDTTASSTRDDSSTDTSTDGTDTTSSETSTDTDSSTADSTSTGPASICGDGLVEGAEECDDPGDTACFNCIRDRLVFVTSQAFHGDWAADAGNLDYWCNHLAAQVGLVEFIPRFMPWVSTSEGSPADRLHHSPGRYVLRNGLVFAQSWDDLVAGNILNPLNVTENSETFNAAVWTDTAPDGTAVLAEDGDHCGDWTDKSFGGWARYGYADQLDSGWTLYPEPRPCAFEAAIYCFESP
jgi:hypothetical protein